MKNKPLLLIIGMILLAAISRLIPHLPNFTPIGAIALFAGVYLQSRKLQLLVPMAALLVSDILLELAYGYGFHGLMPYTYGSVLLIALIGSNWLKNKVSTGNLLLGSLTGSIIFFLITNFGVFTGGYYGPGVFGLVSCYIAAIPFFHYTLLGDLVYNIILFKGFQLVYNNSILTNSQNKPLGQG